MTERDLTIRHEAAHSAAGTLLRQTPTAIEICDDGGRVTLPAGLDREDALDRLLITLAGRVGEDEPNWPPAWPPSRTKSTDEHQAAILAAHLDLDAAGWHDACARAWRLAASRPFTRLEASFTAALKQSSHLDEKAINGLIGATMRHITVKATVTPTTDQGTFTAVISSEAVDREKDVVLASAMVDALSAWNREVPLAWEHSLEPNDVIGTIDPASVHDVNGEVVASGQVDLSTERGAQAWRLMKAGSAAFSFGYMTTDAVKRADGVREVRKLDVFEISVVMAPMNNGTRVLATKAADSGDRPLSHTQVETMLIEQGIIAPVVSSTGQPEAIDEHVRAGARSAMAHVLGLRRNGEDDGKAMVTRAKSTAPISVATFTC